MRLTSQEVRQSLSQLDFFNPAGYIYGYIYIDDPEAIATQLSSSLECQPLNLILDIIVY